MTIYEIHDFHVFGSHSAGSLQKWETPSSLVDLETSFRLKPLRTDVVLNTCLNERSLVIDY